MRYEDAREYLEQYREADRRVRRLEVEYNAELEMVDAVRSTANVDGMPHATGVNKSVEERAIRLADKAKRLADARLDAVEVRQTVFDVIEEVGGEGAEVLYEKYINLKTWAGVCESCYCSSYKAYYVHLDALRKVEEIIKHISIYK